MVVIPKHAPKSGFSAIKKNVLGKTRVTSQLSVSMLSGAARRFVEKSYSDFSREAAWTTSPARHGSMFCVSDV